MLLTPIRSLTAHSFLLVALSSALVLGGCGGDSDGDKSPSTTVTTPTGSTTITAPAAPADLGFTDSAPVQTTVLAFTDTIATNQRGDARYATLDTNAGVRVLAGFRTLWQPLTDLVDAGVSAPALDGFPAVTASTWTGLPNDGTPNGTALNPSVLNTNIQYSVTATTTRTQAQADAAYYDDRRGKGYSVTDGMGPLTTAWRTAAQQTTTITSIPSDATSVAYNDGGNNIGVGGSANTQFGNVVDLISTVGNNASTEPAKRFYKYARPFRWSTSVAVVPTLVPAESSTPSTDGGFPSGHTAEAVRDAVAMAYMVPERFQEMLSRGLELGENRILAGMHSPLDVIGGRILGEASAAANLASATNTTLKQNAVTQAHTALYALTGTDATTFAAYAKSGSSATDRFSDYATNKANYLRRMTFGFSPIASTTAAAVVPKDAEVLLETRLPYLSADQRRVVLKTTAFASGYPAMDDSEGWGRLNLFAAADGYGVFSGNVVISMDASKGGFYAADQWRNDISGTGRLTMQGTGTLKLAGANTYSGGSIVQGGALEADSVTAFGTGDVYVSAGTVISNAPGRLVVTGKYTQLQGGTLQMNLGSNGQGRLQSKDDMTLLGGTLHVTFASGFEPQAGDTLDLISASALKGTFTNVTVDGFKSTPLYTATGLQVRLSN